MMETYFVAGDVIERLAWSLLHSLWQGGLIALAAAWLRLLSPSARWRYTISVGALLMMLVAPVLTFLFIRGTAAAPAAELWVSGGEPALSAAAGAENGVAALRWSHWIVIAWLAGVLLCLARLAAAWHAARRLLSTGTAAVAPATAELFRILCDQFRLGVPVRLLMSARVDTPVAIGWLRPVVLLPLGVVTGLTPAQLEAVLAHELAHIRRHDFLVNLLQRCVESLLFYHPVVWWLSATIRADREDCCDDLALETSVDATTYASALIELERARGVTSVAMAGSGGNLTRRVRRMLNTSQRHDWGDLLVAVALLCALLMTAFYQPEALRAQPGVPETPAPPPPAAAPATETIGMPWMLFHDDMTIANGSSTDTAEARELHQRLGGNMLWFRYADGTYVTRDPQILRRVVETHAQLRELARQQAVLGEDQSRLGEETRSFQIAMPDLEARLEALAADLPTSSSMQDLSELQRALAELQREIGRLQEEAARERARIGRVQREHEEIGHQHAETARRLQRMLRELLQHAVQSGIANPVRTAV